MSKENKSKIEKTLERIQAKKEYMEFLNKHYLSGHYSGPIDAEMIFGQLKSLSKDEDENGENTVTEQSHPLKDYMRKGSKPVLRTEVNSLEGAIHPENLVTVDYFLDSMMADKEGNIRKLMKQAEQSVAKGVKDTEDVQTDIEPYKEILSGQNPDIFITMVALQGKDYTGEAEEKFAVLIYNKKEDRVGIVFDFDSDFKENYSYHRKLRENDICPLIESDYNDSCEKFMNFVKAGNKDIKDDDIYKSVYLFTNPDFIDDNDYAPDAVHFWNTVGSSFLNSEGIANSGLVCRVEKPRYVSVNSKMLSNMQKQSGD